MKSRFAHILGQVRARNGFPGLGFKRAAALANAECTMMRFALEAYRNPGLAAAVDHGIIADPKVVQIFHRLPEPVVGVICELETRLGRPLSRSRAERLVRAYLKASGRPAVGSEYAAAHRSRSDPSFRYWLFRLPNLPRLF